MTAELDDNRDQSIPNVSDEWVSRLVQAVTDGITVVDRDGRFVYANHAAQQLLGVRWAKLAGKQFDDSTLAVTSLAGATLTSDQMPFARVMKTGEPVYNLDIVLNRPDGQRVIVSMNASPNRDELGQTTGVVASLRDVTEQRQDEEALRASEANLSAMLNSGGEAIVLVGRDLRIRASNELAAVFSRSRWGSEMAPGESIHRFVHPEEIDSFNAHFRAALNGQVSRVEREMRHPDDSSGWYEFSYNPVCDTMGDVSHVCLTTRPIDDRRQAEDRLRFLTRSSAVLSMSLDYETTLANLARICLPFLADLCLVSMIQPDGSMSRLAIAHVDPEKERLVREIERRWPLRVDPGFGIGQVLSTGEPRIIPDFGEAELAAFSHDEEHLRSKHTLGYHSYICVPLIARGRVLGAISLLITETSRRYTDADLTLAQELATRAALAIDNARLYGESQDAVRRKDETLALLDTFLTSAPVAFAFVDTEQRLMRVNQKLAEINEIPLNDHLGRTIAEVTPLLDRLIAPLIEQVLRTSEPVVGNEIQVPATATREGRVWLVNCYPIKPVDGEIFGVGLILEDITERKAVEQEHIRLLEREQEARARAEHSNRVVERIQSITDTALQHLALDDLLDELLTEIQAMLETDTASILLREGDSQMLTIRTVHGIEEVVAQGVKVPIGQGFGGRIAADQHPRIIDDLSREDVFHEFMVRRGIRSLMGVPLMLKDRVVGVVHVGMLRPRRFTADDLQLLQLAATRIAMAVDRAALFEAEREAREAAEQAQRRLAFLAQASALLGSSLDYETILDRVSRLAIPFLADTCTVHLVDTDGALRQVTSTHIEPTDGSAVVDPNDQPAPAPNGLQPTAAVLEAGQSILIPEITDDLLETIAHSPEHLHELRRSALSSVMMVPLLTRDRVIGALTLAMTVSGRHYTEEELVLAEELSHRSALAVDNAWLYQDAQAAVVLREQFISIASHELKTPLTTVKGYVQLLARDVKRPTIDVQRLERTIERLSGQVGRFEQLVGELLDVSRIQQGLLDLQPEWCDLAQLAQDVFNRFQHVPERKPNHRLVLHAPEPVEHIWDASRLDQVLTNLLSNALKYSPEGGLVQVDVVKREGNAEIVVRDEGIGISSAEQAFLFQAFSRGERARQTAPGAGLGLHITSEIVRRHGGTIRVESVAGRGTTFTITLPLTPRPRIARVEEPDPQ